MAATPVMAWMISMDAPRSKWSEMMPATTGPSEKPSRLWHETSRLMANRGTLFLDEVSELSPGAQGRLLRVLDYPEIRRVGGSRRIPVNVRVIAATNKDLLDLVQKGMFREDLLYRLNVYPLRVPSLTERLADIPILARYFYKNYAKTLNRPDLPALSQRNVEWMLGKEWPGNVRQLRHVIERGVLDGIYAQSPDLALGGIWLDSSGDQAEATPQKTPHSRHVPTAAMAEAIQQALEACSGKIAGRGGAAEMLGINAATLRSRIAILKRKGLWQDNSRN